MAKKAQAEAKRETYSIGEWYGHGIEKLSQHERFEASTIEVQATGLTGKNCPFVVSAKCNKRGGICSLRRYQDDGIGTAIGSGPIVTTCPRRFRENDEIFRWVGEVVLGTPDAVVLKEIGFLAPLSAKGATAAIADEAREFIGKIDNVLIHPTNQSLEWCALELQAVYFSGDAMSQEFAKLSSRQWPSLPYPAGKRHPDWRSSGPKRLLPQLQTKVPAIRTWGKKTAVVIDEAFFASLVGLEPVAHLSNAEIAWFVVRYEPSANGWKLIRHDVVYTSLDSSVKALTGGIPLPKEKFEQQLCQKLRQISPQHPALIAQRKN